jgi:hypothetical protein
MLPPLLDRYPLDIDIKLRNILYWAKLITGKDIKLSIISYRLLYLSQNLGGVIFKLDIL